MIEFSKEIRLMDDTISSLVSSLVYLQENDYLSCHKGDRDEMRVRIATAINQLGEVDDTLYKCCDVIKRQSGAD